ncbi:MAG: hypothetical protein IT301_06770 [Dehalococcoidia bacterium]|nr:hypothetical protein [Dehalococcoidia bacterium]
MPDAYFGKPQSTFVPGGAHIAIYLAPVFEGGLVVFDVTVSAARGRWLPWAILPFGGNPYEAAATLADLWCEGAVSDLALVDVMSVPFQAGGWELAIVFRAALTQAPGGDETRTPVVLPPGRFDAIGNFDPVDLERWVGERQIPQEAPPPSENKGLIF